MPAASPPPACADHDLHLSPSAEAERLGFMIDDAPHTPAVAPDAMDVDLYGYTSMIVAAVQAQAKEIEALQREVAGLRRTKPAKCSRLQPSSHR